MTRTFHEKIKCEKCGHRTTAQSEFEEWFRNHPQLDSAKSGVVRFDLDILLHRYKVLNDAKGSRDVQFMMFIEVKTFMAKSTESQRDTLSILNQILRNRRSNINSTGRRQVIRQPNKARSKLLKRDITIKMYGGHLLQMDGTTPENSSLMLWDYDPIDPQMLIELFLFERDPDRIHLMMDHRRRSLPFKQMPLLDFES